MKEIMNKDTPAPIGPYSQAIEAKGLIFVSGQIALGESTEAQAKKIFDNINVLLKKAGSSLNKIVKISVFLTDMNDFSSLNNIFSDVLSRPYPARETIEVTRLPKDALLEISVIAEK